jgi:hypothetical protein
MTVGTGRICQHQCNQNFLNSDGNQSVERRTAHIGQVWPRHHTAVHVSSLIEPPLEIKAGAYKATQRKAVAATQSRPKRCQTTCCMLGLRQSCPSADY